MEFYINPEVELAKVTDSMELDSGTQIAELKDDGITASLEVRGEVKVFWNGDCYTTPSDFPKTLKDLIHNSGIEKKHWTCDPRVYVSENNWFEVLYAEDGFPFVDGVVVDAEKCSPKELLDLLHDVIQSVAEKKQK